MPRSTGLKPLSYTKQENSTAGLAGWSVFGFEGGELFLPLEAGGLEEADAAVPAEDGVVVSGGTNFFSFAEALEGAFEERE